MEAERRELEFLRTLGSGGFGAVYLCNLHGRDRFVRRVAVKVMREGLDATPDLVARQKDEARLLGLLAHDGIVQVLDLTEIDGRPAVVMEYVEGVDLADLLRSSPRRVPLRAALEIVAGVAAALDAAYNSTSAVTGQPLRVIHRDIKPANVLLTVHGRVKVLDFGVAKADFARDGHTTNGGWGTPRFMSAEQWLGEPYGAPVDVYALGVTLFDLVADRPWERPPLARAAFEAHVAGQLDAQKDVPEEVLALVAAMTSFDANDRPTAVEVRERCEVLSAQVGGESLARFARAEVPSLVEARSRTNANKPLPGVVSLGGVSPSRSKAPAEPTHDLSVQEPSNQEPSMVAGAAGPAPATRGNGIYYGAAIAAFVGFGVFIVLALLGLKMAGVLDTLGPGAPPPTAEAVPEAVPAGADPAEPAPALADPAATAITGEGAGTPAAEVVPAEEPAAPPPAEVAPTPAEPTRTSARKSRSMGTEPAPSPAPVPAQAPAAAPATVEAAPRTWPVDIASRALGDEVWVDGVKVGKTPLKDLPLPQGAHTVQLVVKGERTPPYTVRVGADGPERLLYYPDEAKWRTE